MKFIFVGDSWALKGFTQENYHYNINPMAGDIRLADHWPWEYEYCFASGQGNIACLNKFKKEKFDSSIPIIWILTEPGRDYHLITGRPEFEWIESEDIMDIRQHLLKKTMQHLSREISNPVTFIGGLSDVPVKLAQSFGFHVAHPSWQKWIAEKLNSQWFKFGWGAGDIGWRANYNGVVPSKAATFAWDEQIKEWCWWEEQGYFCHEHPTPLANQEFAEFLKPTIEEWLKQYE
jgi:hypothetical protein